MPINVNTLAYRRDLPHLRSREKVYFVTFCTYRRTVLLPEARDIALGTVAYEHTKTCWIDCAVVMPDHVHLQLQPYENVSLEAIVARIKSVSAHRINRAFGTRGHVWQHESFDYILRSCDGRQQKADYILENPVRAGIVARTDDYRWSWTPPGAAAPHR